MSALVSPITPNSSNVIHSYSSRLDPHTPKPQGRPQPSSPSLSSTEMSTVNQAASLVQQLLSENNHLRLHILELQDRIQQSTQYHLDRYEQLKFYSENCEREIIKRQQREVQMLECIAQLEERLTKSEGLYHFQTPGSQNPFKVKSNTPQTYKSTAHKSLLGTQTVPAPQSESIMKSKNVIMRQKNGLQVQQSTQFRNSTDLKRDWPPNRSSLNNPVIRASHLSTGALPPLPRCSRCQSLQQQLQAAQNQLSLKDAIIEDLQTDIEAIMQLI